jgi:hypothetical protein
VEYITASFKNTAKQKILAACCFRVLSFGTLAALRLDVSELVFNENLIPLNLQ